MHHPSADRRPLTAAAIVAAAAVAATALLSVPASAAPPPEPSSLGTEFWLGFNSNTGTKPELTVTVTGDPGTKGTVEIPGSGFHDDYTVGDDGVALISLPVGSQVRILPRMSGSEPKAVHVTADHEVTVYGMNRAPNTTDGYLGLPVSAIGTRYRIADYGGGFLSIVPAESGVTTATIELPAGLGIDPFDITIEQGEVYQYEAPSNSSLTGAIVTTDKKASVYGGNRCTNIPLIYPACDHIVEQLQPTDSWGTTYVTSPLVPRHGDTFRVIADADGTTVTISGDTTNTISLGAGEYHEWITDAPQVVIGDKQIEVVQYSNGSKYDGILDADPFMAIVPSVEQGFTHSTIAPPSEGFTNYVNLTARTADIAGVRFDGTVVAADRWQPIAGSDFSVAVLELGDDVHTIDSTGPVMTLVYGWAEYESYGYPGGARLARIAAATKLTLTPAEVVGGVGETLCTTATLTDADGRGVAGARIDVTSVGSEPGTTSVVTDAEGTASICLTSAQPGDTTVTATTGSLTAEVVLRWQTAGQIPADSEPDAETDPSPSPEGSPAPQPDADPQTQTAASPKVKSLADTGSNADGLPVAGGAVAVALAAGALLLSLTRRRRHIQH